MEQVRFHFVPIFMESIITQTKTIDKFHKTLSSIDRPMRFDRFTFTMNLWYRVNPLTDRIVDRPTRRHEK